MLVDDRLKANGGPGPGAPPLQLRPLTARDEAPLSALLTRNDVDDVTCHFHPFALNAQSARAIVTEPGLDRYFGGWLGDELVGLSMLRGFNEGYEVPSFGVMVDRARHGRGIGRDITRITIERAREIGCPRVRLTVYRSNHRAHRLYESLGFVERERSPHGAGDERIVMDLALAAAPLYVAAPVLDGNELAYVRDCLESEWISSIGGYVERFEREFAAFCGVEHGVSCCNGTAALHIALLAAGVGPGDEVIVPALTYVACGNAVAYCGATPVFVDSDPQTWTLEPAAVADAVGPRTRAILAVHLYGHPADMDALREIADRHGLAVIEDAAEAHGARYRGRPAGSLGDVATFSFFGNKILTTGEGGMVVTDDAELAATARLLRGQGQDPQRRYWHIVRGFNYRMTNVAAAIGVAQLEQADRHIARRREIAGWYADALRDEPRLRLSAQASWAQHAHWMSCAVVEGATALERDTVMARLAAERIETRPFFPALHELPIFAGAAPPGAFPVSERLAASGICLPSSGRLVRDDIVRVADALRRAIADVPIAAP